MKAHTEVRRGEKSQPSGPGSELRLGMEKEKEKVRNIIDGMCKQKRRKSTCIQNDTYGMLQCRRAKHKMMLIITKT